MNFRFLNKNDIRSNNNEAIDVSQRETNIWNVYVENNSLNDKWMRMVGDFTYKTDHYEVTTDLPYKIYYTYYYAFE